VSLPSAGFRFRPAPGVRTRVAVGAGALGLLGTELARIAPGRWLAVSAAPVWALHGERVRAAAGTRSLHPEPVLVPDGEKAKTWKVLGRLVEELLARGLRRDGGIVAAGGGTVGDVAGLAAALALRGVPVVQVPTTLLAAADSALGGKTAVDFPSGKNLAGVVHHPSLVLVEPLVLATLPDRDYRSGLAEVVKSALLDASFYRRFPALAPALRARESAAVSEAVLRSLRMKARVVASDHDEKLGRRHVLNLGHTVGHALEQASGHALAHGEAVAWGLLATLVLSERRAGLSRGVSARAEGWVRDLVGPPAPSRSASARWEEFLASDKKADSIGTRAVVLSAPGRAALLRAERDELAEALEEGRRRYNTAADG
jgi:3-dehydroquinate synthase